MTTLVCPKCRTEYILGTEGTRDGCDVCLGIERISDMASNHSAWLPGETYHLYDGKRGIVKVTREQAREQAATK
jgi:hypothetical protein